MHTRVRHAQNRTRPEIQGFQIRSTSSKTIIAAITIRKTSVLKQTSNTVTTGLPVALWKTVIPTNPRKRTGMIHNQRGARKRKLKSAEKKSNQFSSHDRSMNRWKNSTSHDGIFKISAAEHDDCRYPAQKHGPFDLQQVTTDSTLLPPHAQVAPNIPVTVP